jgi:uncharacterized protein (TIGR00251 family)
MSIAETKNGVTLKVFVKPNSPKFKIEFNGDEIVVYSTEEPVKGKVNKEIIKELTKLLHTKVELVSGATCRQKQFFVNEMDKLQAEQLLKLKSSYSELV